MVKDVNWLAILGVFSLLALIVGVIIGSIGFPKVITNTQLVEKKDCPACIPTETKEVVKEVVKEVKVEVPTDYKAKALAEFMNYVEDNDEMQVCSGNTYDLDQIKVSKVSDAYSVNFNKDKEVINISPKLKYLDADTNVKCYEEFNAEVTFEEGEEPVVEILE